MKKRVSILFFALFLAAFSPSVFGGEASEPILEKTLIAWVSPETLNQSGGSVLTLNNLAVDQFDGIIFAELTPQVWMPGSNFFTRTNREQADWPKETASNGQFVQMAVVYAKNEITVYRNGEVYARYPVDNLVSFSADDSVVLFGQRHYHKSEGFFYGKIRDARIYATALDQATITAMKPGAAVSGVEAWA